MIRKILNFVLLLLISLVPSTVFSQNSEKETAVEKTKKYLAEIVKESYAELENVKIKVEDFHSESDFFKARFSFTRYLTFRKINYIIFVNPKIYRSEVSEKAIIAILAHELAHVLYYRKKNRFELFGLMSLLNKNFTTKFERKADLQTIKRGYGEGLIIYREWLYKQIPEKSLAEKKRDYFTLEEIKAIMDKSEKIDFWLKNVPRDLKDIK